MQKKHTALAVVSITISFSTNVGGGAWNLAECAAWATTNGFDAIRPNVNGLFEPNQIIQSDGKDVKEILSVTDIYLAALTSHCNLLDDDLEKRENARNTLIQAIEAAHILDIPIVVTYAGSPVGWHFYGQFSSEPGNPRGSFRRTRPTIQRDVDSCYPLR